MAGRKFEGLVCPFLEMHLFVLCCHFFTLDLIFLVAFPQAANLNII